MVQNDAHSRRNEISLKIIVHELDNMNYIVVEYQSNTFSSFCVKASQTNKPIY